MYKLLSLVVAFICLYTGSLIYASFFKTPEFPAM